MLFFQDGEEYVKKRIRKLVEVSVCSRIGATGFMKFVNSLTFHHTHFISITEKRLDKTDNLGLFNVISLLDIQMNHS